MLFALSFSFPAHYLGILYDRIGCSFVHIPNGTKHTGSIQYFLIGTQF